MTTIETMRDIARGVEALGVAEPRFRTIVEITDLPPLRRRQDHFAALLDIIVSQQLSKASADAIWKRMEQGLKPFAPDRFLTLADDEFRAAGLSRPKVKTMRALSRAICEDGLDLACLCDLDDEAVHENLTAVSGIGPWTADIFLLSCLGRADAWPAGDLALQVAAGHVFGLAERPDKDRLQAMADPWRPWRAIAARLLWAYYSTTRIGNKEAGQA